jgi:hypothetical protein
MAAGGLDAEALEGLMLVKNKQNLASLEGELNEFVAKRTKTRRIKRRFAGQLWWAWVAAGTLGLLALAAMAWWIIAKLLS